MMEPDTLMSTFNTKQRGVASLKTATIRLDDTMDREIDAPKTALAQNLTPIMRARLLWLLRRP